MSSVTTTEYANRIARDQPLASRSPDFDPVDLMLLTADGTVTTLLEACTGETIATRATHVTGPATLDRQVVAADGWWRPDARLLEPAPDERLIARRVVLRGARSGSAYVLAESVVALDRLPATIGDRLVRGGASLGRLLAAGSIETRREVLQITAVRAGTASDYLAVQPGATLARRTYKIVIAQRAAAVVTEWLAPGRLAATALGSGHELAGANGATSAPAAAQPVNARSRRFMSDLTCVVVDGDGVYSGAQGFDYFEGISAQTAGARGLCMHRLEIPPGGSARPHLHEHHETAIYVLRGRSEVLYGEGLRERLEVRAGQFLFIPAGMPHLPSNPSDREACVAVLARTDPNEQESVVLLDEDGR